MAAPASCADTMLGADRKATFVGLLSEGMRRTKRAKVIALDCVPATNSVVAPAPAAAVLVPPTPAEEPRTARREMGAADSGTLSVSSTPPRALRPAKRSKSEFRTPTPRSRAARGGAGVADSKLFRDLSIVTQMLKLTISGSSSRSAVASGGIDRKQAPGIGDGCVASIPTCAGCGERPDIEDIDVEFKCRHCTALNKPCQICDRMFAAREFQNKCAMHRSAMCGLCGKDTLHGSSTHGSGTGSAITCSLCGGIHFECRICNCIVLRQDASNHCGGGVCDVCQAQRKGAKPRKRVADRAGLDGDCARRDRCRDTGQRTTQRMVM